jgi:hypothetical protein
MPPPESDAAATTRDSQLPSGVAASANAGARPPTASTATLMTALRMTGMSSECHGGSGFAWST